MSATPADKPVDAAAAAQPPGGSSIRWPIIVIGLLGLHVVIMAAAAVVATRDRAYVVVPDYYQKAVRWDQSKAEHRASQQLGWQPAITTGDQVDPLGRRSIAIDLKDAQGNPVADAQVEVSFFHHTWADKVERATFKSDARGHAAGTVVMRPAGFYEFNLTIAAREQKFVATLTQYVTNLQKPGDRR